MEQDIQREITLYAEGTYQTDEQYTVAGRVLPVRNDKSELYRIY